MKQPLDLARRFFSLAGRDAKVFRILADNPDIDDESVGFHAQQTVEKCLKAILAKYQIEFRKTHDLFELLSLIRSQRLPEPPFVENLSDLTPFAVLLRYDFMEFEGLDRSQAKEIVEAILEWTRVQVG